MSLRLVLALYIASIVTGSLCNEQMHPALGKLLQSVQAACNADSGDGFQKVAESMQNIYQCPAVTEIMTQLMDKNHSDTLSNCSSERLLPCYGPLLDSITKCLSRNSEDNLKVLQRIVKEVVDVSCKNRTTAADPKVFYSCLDQIDSLVEDCKAPFVNPSVPISDLDEAECSEVARSKSCVAEKLTACGAGITVPGISAIFHAIQSENRCDQSSEEESTESD